MSKTKSPFWHIQQHMHGARHDISVVYSDHDHSSAASNQQHIALIFRGNVHLLDIIKPGWADYYYVVPTHSFKELTALKVPESEMYSTRAKAVKRAIEIIDSLTVLPASAHGIVVRYLSKIVDTSVGVDWDLDSGVEEWQDLCSSTEMESIASGFLSLREFNAIHYAPFNTVANFLLMVLAEADPKRDAKIVDYLANRQTEAWGN